jgi:hypothetical protein
MSTSGSRGLFQKAVSGVASMALFASMSTLSIHASAWEGWGDETATFNPVTTACGNGAIGNFSVFEGAHDEGCDWVGTFAEVECTGNGRGRITGYIIIRLRQTSRPGCGN